MKMKKDESSTSTATRFFFSFSEPEQPSAPPSPSIETETYTYTTDTDTDSTNNTVMTNQQQQQEEEEPQEQEEEESDENTIYHTVEPSDSLRWICLKYKVTAPAIRAANNDFIGNNLKFAPEMLRIPSASATAATVITTDTDGIRRGLINPRRRTAAQELEGEGALINLGPISGSADSIRRSRFNILILEIVILCKNSLLWKKIKVIHPLCAVIPDFKNDSSHRVNMKYPTTKP